jgi:hypothetical protein
MQPTYHSLATEAAQRFIDRAGTIQQLIHELEMIRSMIKSGDEEDAPLRKGQYFEP